MVLEKNMPTFNKLTRVKSLPKKLYYCATISNTENVNPNEIIEQCDNYFVEIGHLIVKSVSFVRLEVFFEELSISHHST